MSPCSSHFSLISIWIFPLLSKAVIEHILSNGFYIKICSLTSCVTLQPLLFIIVLDLSTTLGIIILIQLIVKLLYYLSVHNFSFKKNEKKRWFQCQTATSHPFLFSYSSIFFHCFQRGSTGQFGKNWFQNIDTKVKFCCLF